MRNFSHQIIKNNLWVHLNGKTLCVPLTTTSKGKKRKTDGAGGDQILAPMPGKVTKVLATSDQQVKKGDSLVVMEAMKMEYTLKSEVNGKVTSIECKVGEQVELGQLLIQLKSQDAVQ